VRLRRSLLASARANILGSALVHGPLKMMKSRMPGQPLGQERVDGLPQREQLWIGGREDLAPPVFDVGEVGSRQRDGGRRGNGGVPPFSGFSGFPVEIFQDPFGLPPGEDLAELLGRDRVHNFGFSRMRRARGIGRVALPVQRLD
jgi:hypothetical protein